MSFLALAPSLLGSHSVEAANPVSGATGSVSKNSVKRTFNHQHVNWVMFDSTEEYEALARPAFVLRGSPEGQALEVAKNAKLTTFVRVHETDDERASTSTQPPPSIRTHSTFFGYSGLQVV
jgi:hypothetical protein